VAHVTASKFTLFLKFCMATHFAPHNFTQTIPMVVQAKAASAAPAAVAAQADPLLAVRQAMLSALHGVLIEPASITIWLCGRIGKAHDAQALWALVADWMFILIADKGDTVAQEHLNAVAALFKDHMPRG
jgi:hypothetical protein